MASTWPGWLHKYFSDNVFKWRERFVWWPVYSHVSEQRIWLKKAWYGYRLAYGPAGEEPVKIERWMTAEEYMWHQLLSAD